LEVGGRRLEVKDAGRLANKDGESVLLNGATVREGGGVGFGGGELRLGAGDVEIGGGAVFLAGGNEFEGPATEGGAAVPWHHTGKPVASTPEMSRTTPSTATDPIELIESTLVTSTISTWEVVRFGSSSPTTAMSRISSALIEPSPFSSAANPSATVTRRGPPVTSSDDSSVRLASSRSSRWPP